MPLRDCGRLSRPDELVRAVRLYLNRGSPGRRPAETVPPHPNDSESTAVSAVDVPVVADVAAKMKSMRNATPRLLRFLTDTLLLFLAAGLLPARSEEHTSELQSRRDLVC